MRRPNTGARTRPRYTRRKVSRLRTTAWQYSTSPQKLTNRCTTQAGATQSFLTDRFIISKSCGKNLRPIRLKQRGIRRGYLRLTLAGVRSVLNILTGCLLLRYGTKKKKNSLLRATIRASNHFFIGRKRVSLFFLLKSRGFWCTPFRAGSIKNHSGYICSFSPLPLRRG